MTIANNPSELFSPFLPTTYDIPQEQDRLHSFLEETLANTADVINDKSIGTFTDTVSSFNGNKIIYDTNRVRNGFNYLARVKSYPSNGTLVLPMPANVNPQFVILQTWGSASLPCSKIDAGDGIYFSFNCEGDSRITYTISDTLITITTIALGSGYSGFIVISFIGDGI